jgi:hypothetical protein
MSFRIPFSSKVSLSTSFSSFRDDIINLN